MVPLLKFYFHEEVRQAAVQAMPELLRSASLAVAAGRGPDTTFVKQMLDFIWTPLMEAMAKVRCRRRLTGMLSMIEPLRLLGCCLCCHACEMRRQAASIACSLQSGCSAFMVEDRLHLTLVCQRFPCCAIGISALGPLMGGVPCANSVAYSGTAV